MAWCGGGCVLASISDDRAMPFDPPRPWLPDPEPRVPPRLATAVRRGVGRTCPACGKGRLFCGFLAVQPICAVCGNDNEQYPSDDFAPYVTIFLVLHLMVPFLIFADHFWNPSVWVEGVIAIPIFAAATIGLLPFAKGGVIGFACAMDVTRQQPDDLS